MSDHKQVTLRMGLEQFYRDHDGELGHTELGPAGLSLTETESTDEVSAFFRSHDIAHVLFGCDISLLGEGSVKIWTIFGTTLGLWDHVRLYKKADALGLSQNFTLSHVATHLPRLLLSIPRLILRARRMSRPWPWSDFEPYLDVPISEIRREFNIRGV